MDFWKVDGGKSDDEEEGDDDDGEATFSASSIVIDVVSSRRFVMCIYCDAKGTSLLTFLDTNFPQQ